MDYAYTLQGWLKSINASTLDVRYDMGNDGHNIGQNRNTARDAVAFSLRYFQNDYSQIGRITTPVEASLPAAMNSLNLYNGNISSQTVSLKGVQNPTQSYQYRYDQLNRLVQMDAYRSPVVQNNNLSTATLTTDYQERISYDPNGNILTYSRKKDGGADMDNLTYTYDAQKKNQLKQVQDAVQDGAYNLDIDNQANTQNYKYDAIGNLIRDEQEDMDIFWTPTGKIAKINQNKKQKTLIFAYDPMGNRISKTVQDMTGKKKPFTTYYTRDAQGNTLAVYDNHYYENNIKWCAVRREDVLEAMDKVIEWEQNCATQRNPQCKTDQYESYQRLLAAKDSCKYKIQAYIYQQQMPCDMEPQYIDFLEQLYNQDHDSYTQLDPSGQEDYLNTKEQEYSPQVNDAIGCFMIQLRYVLNMDIAQRDEYFNAYRNGTLKDQLTDKYYNELAGQQLAYGKIIDTCYTDSLYWQEQHLYGSSRLGMAKPNIEVTNYKPSNISWVATNFKNYELTNHLGNVLATIKDEKKQVSLNGTTVDYYEPIVMTATDYYPFGMPMPNRSFTLAPEEKYRFGFNTQEKDDEVYGVGNLNTAEFWEYDTRIGRRWNRDPKPVDWESPYAVNRDNPILFNDPKGDDPFTGVGEAVFSFAVSAGMDFMTGYFIEGKSAQQSFDDIGWMSAGWDAAKTYAFAAFTPPGTATASKVMKIANSKVGKLTLGISEKMMTKAGDNYLKGNYNDGDGNFDFDKVNMSELFWESTVETLIEQGLGGKAEEVLATLKKENKTLYQKLTKLENKVENGESAKRVANYTKKVAQQEKTVSATKKEFKKSLVKEKAVTGTASKVANEKRKETTTGN